MVFATTRPAPIADRTKRELCGVVQRVVWSDPESGAVIATLKTGETVKGECPDGELEPRTAYRFLGRWTENPRYGWQFSFDSLVLDTPLDRRGVVQYLARAVRGPVTQRVAEKLWDLYGADTVAVLRTDPCRVAETGLLSIWAAGEAAKVLQKLAAVERTTVDLFGLFAGKGFPRSTIAAAIDKWGVRAAEVVRRDPFAMLTAELPGVGFKRADGLYLELGRNRNRLKRQMLAAWAALRDDSDGHTWHIEGAARKAILSAVGLAASRFDRAIGLGIRSGWLATRRDAGAKLFVTEREKAVDESRAARHLARLLAAQRCLWPALPADSHASEHQRAGWDAIRHSPVALLNGTPGTGKTFLAALILKAVIHQYGRSRVAVAAPTGKAAVRISEAMARYGLGLEATTIHRLLRVGRNGHDGKGWGFEHGERNPLAVHFLAVDETSMTDVPLMAALLAACPDGCHVLFIGDPYQLPPVGHGAPLRDMIAAGVPSTILTEIRRQDGASLIVKACAQIKDGKRFETCDRYDPDAGRNLRLIEAEDAAGQLEVLRRVIDLVRARFDPVNETQVLCALNESSPVSRKPLNELLQGMLNPEPEGGNVTGDGEVRKRNKVFRVGDKVICLRNSIMQAWGLLDGRPADDVEAYEKEQQPPYAGGGPVEVFVANGDMGRVEAADEQHVVARFAGPDRVVKIQMRKGKGEDGENAEGGTGGDFDLAYAVTVHKSQGSEWPCVVVMVDEQAGMVASREHLYTAISRAGKLCVLIGRRDVADRQCRKVSLTKRKTFLRELIEEMRGPKS